MRNAVVAIALAVAAACTEAAPEAFRVEPDLTATRFAVNELGIVRQRGRFQRTWGAIVLDPARAAGTVDFIIDATSVATGWGLRDAFLRGEYMFDVDQFPAIRFRSTHLSYAAGQLVAVDGDVTLRGVTRPVRLDVKRLRCSHVPARGREECAAEVATRISRRAFGMTYAYPFVGDDIDLDVAITAFRVRDSGETEPP